MKTIAQYFSEHSAWIRFHIVCVAFFSTGLIMAMSATEFGAIAAFVVLLGIYTMLFATIAEGLFLALSAVRKTATFYLKRNQPADFQDSFNWHAE